MNLTLNPRTRELEGSPSLPASKSESNRALILRALSHGRIRIHNLSEADDTRVLDDLLRHNPGTMDVGHAGTAMRFLAAYLAFRPEDKILTGSPRMLERPIGPLVDALRALGADIHYLGREGYPPLAIYGRNAKWGADEVEVPGDVSSQFISALLMVAPTLPDGLQVRLSGESRSWPYIQMTLDLMGRFGVNHTRNGPCIAVPKQLYRAGEYTIEADWSAAGYWFVAAGLSERCNILLEGLRPDTLQGDSAVVGMAAALGVRADWEPAGLRLRKLPVQPPTEIDWDFTDCPDLAQGMLVLVAGLGLGGRFRGLESLRIKETDRIAAMQAELARFGMELREAGDHWVLEGRFSPVPARIHTYGDHRMAMAFAPLALRAPGLTICDAEVVTKSYPQFWEALDGMGIAAIPGPH